MIEDVKTQLIKYADEAYEKSIRDSVYTSNAFIQNILNEYDKPEYAWLPNHYSPYVNGSKLTIRSWIRGIKAVWVQSGVIGFPSDWNTHMEPVAEKANLHFRRMIEGIMKDVSEDSELYGYDAISSNGFICKSNVFNIPLDADGKLIEGFPAQRVFLQE